MTWRTLRKGHLLLVTIGISVESNRVYHPLVVHQLVPFVIGEGVELIGFRIPDNLVGFDDLGLTRVLLRLLEFVQDILTHDVVIELTLAFAVETEASHLAFNVTKLGLVAIVLGAARYEFHDVVLLVQFTRKLSEVITQGRVGLPLLLQEDVVVGVVVEDTLTQLFQGGIESEPGPTGGETGDEDVKVG